MEAAIPVFIFLMLEHSSGVDCQDFSEQDWIFETISCTFQHISVAIQVCPSNEQNQKKAQQGE